MGPVGSAAAVWSVENPLPGTVWSLATFAPPKASATPATTAEALRKPGDMRQRSLIIMRSLPLPVLAVHHVRVQPMRGS